MNKKQVLSLLGLVLAGALLGACGNPAPDPATGQEEVEIAVAATLTAVAQAPQATDTQAPQPTVTLAPTDEPSNGNGGAETQPPPASATPASVATAPAATAPAPTAPPVTAPVPTPVLVAVLPVDGGGDDTLNIRNNNPVKDGRNVTLPGFSPAEASNPMVFRDRMVFRVEVFDSNVGTYDGAGIDNVRFTITDPQGEQVHFRQESTPGYCVFAGGEPECRVWIFALTGNRWPDGAALTSGSHSVTIDIQPTNGDVVQWFWSFEVQLPDAGGNGGAPTGQTAHINSITLLDTGAYSVDFQVSGFTPDLLGQHVHFFFDTVAPDQAGLPGFGPWYVYAGSSPFTGYSQGDRPQGATQMCVLVADAFHAVTQNTGNCYPLP